MDTIRAAAGVKPAAQRGPFFSFGPFRQKPLLAVCAVWAAIVVFNYFNRDRPFPYDAEALLKTLPPVATMRFSAFAAHLRRLAILAAALLAITGVGRLALTRGLKIERINAFESLFFSCALGLGIAGYAMFFLAAVGGLNVPVVACVSLAACAAAYRHERSRFLSAGLARDLRLILRADAWTGVAATSVIVILAVYLIYSLAPETFFDSLVYHLALPSLFKLEHRFVPVLSNMYSGMPMQFEMVYLWALFADGAILAKLLHWTCSAAVVVGLLGLALRRERPLAGWLAAAIFLSTPVVAINLTRSGIDVATCCWVFAAIYALTLALADLGTEAAKPFWILSAIFTGLAMGSKYTIWPILPVLLLIFLVLRIRTSDIARYALIAGVCLAPWLVKNLWFYGNPIFPYLQDRLHPGVYPVDWHLLVGDGWGRDWPSILRSGRAIFEVVANPWFVTMRGRTEFDDIGPIFLLGLPLLFWFRAASTEARAWRLALAGLWAAWWIFSAMPRFFMPGLLLMSVWIALGVSEFENKIARRAALILILGLVWNNFCVSAATLRSPAAFGYLFEGGSDADYLAGTHRTYFAPYYKAAQWINANAPPESRVLIVGDGRGFYLERPFVGYSHLDVDLFSFWLNRSSTPEEFKARLDAEKITHLLVNMGTLMRAKKAPALDPARLRLLDEFLKRYTKVSFNDQELNDSRWCMVYSVVPDRGPRARPSDFLYFWYNNQLGFRRAG
ncbi:MAG: ArnT family glycosyltransferase [Elusimicrobiota bacterium]